MCGILAILLESDKKISDLSEIVKGHKNLSKRGPDRGFIKIVEKYVLAFRRLCIVDTSIKGDQPFLSEGVEVVCNGEIYNHKDIEKKYGLYCSSGSDCECIIELYKKIGFERMIMELDGVFAIVLIDGNEMYLARDRIGVRPLYTGTTRDGDFVVSSTVDSIADYCTNISQLPPGGYVRRGGKLEKITTWNIPNVTLDKYDSRDTIRELLTKAVEKRLMADRPIACMLSGGLDSSLVTSIMCKLIGAENVRTYSIGIRGSEDLKYAKIVADYLGTTHNEITFEPSEGFTAIESVIRDMETYDVTTIRAGVGMWLLAEYISKNTDDIVIMSGEGSDEIFGGYLYFHHAPSSKELEDETRKLVDNLYKYDVLRADRCISSHGLEPRVPFLDRDFVNFVLSIPGELRGVINGYEKYILRDSFSDGYLPEEVLWRRKDGFSDGVSGGDMKWYEYIQSFIKENATVDDEEAYYRNILRKIYPNFNPVYERWLPKWVEHNGDPSGRNVSV